MNGLESLLAIMGGNPADAIRKAYPNAQITSGFRGPNHPLTRKNPSSRHAVGSPDHPGAIDVAPIPGVRFDDFVSRMRQELPILKALDEQKNPTPWTTGPNWHLSLDLNKQNYGAPQRPDEMSDAEKAARAAAFNVQIPGSATEGIAQGAVTGAMLPPDAQQAFPQAMAQAQGAEQTKKKYSGLFPGSDIGAIAGILGDALMAYGGMQPQFGPMTAKRNAMEREAELQAERDRIKALEPPGEVQTAQYWARMQQEDPVGFARAMAAKDVVSPNYEQVTDAEGYVREVRKDRVETREIPGKGKFVKVNGEWYQVGGN